MSLDELGLAVDERWIGSGWTVDTPQVGCHGPAWIDGTAGLSVHENSCTKAVAHELYCTYKKTKSTFQGPNNHNGYAAGVKKLPEPFPRS